ncbi:hypothetical protein D3879_10600 [Pseudomonas cavernicola]|uniref:Uncharacterized protein n=1 Tax=Pseudomonas cavernicola TaxID=2320866 RepID=A0A418XMH1_9PSED|nr:gamma-mobile-trio protein GmtX [Pseudomonas cavernicola]RJG13653.1 hypothetical protein D3879_10600 [Pseudomonas cavernicola]
MSEQLISPQETFARLINDASDIRRKRSLEALNEVCELLHQRGSPDFSYKTIVTLGKDRGLPVPGEKSIVNSTGEHYRELIQAWKHISIQGVISSKPSQSNWIDKIEDPVVRMSVQLLAKELRALKAKAARQSYHSAPIYLGGQAGHEAPSPPQYNEMELMALKAAIDPETLAPLGLSIGSRGEVIDSKGRTVHKPGFRDAIEKVLSLKVV